MVALDGPHRVSGKLQVRIPIRIARELSIDEGDLYYWRVSETEPGIVQLIPVEVVERRYSVGERLERSAGGAPVERDHQPAGRPNE